MINKPYQLVVFDWEGTLSDSLGQVLHTLTDEADKLGFGRIELYSAKKYVDLGLFQAIKKLFPQLSQEQHQTLMDAVQHSLVTHYTEVWLIPGAKELIQQLQEAGIHLAIATNKGQHSLQKALQLCGLEAYFKVTRSAGQTPAKPCPQMLEEIMEAFGCTASTTLMIGDSTSDMEMAKSIQVDAIGLDFYNQQEQGLQAAGAMKVFGSYSQLAHFLGFK